uniref:Uncharacterized protein n=1 Tax=Zea mays TaxID=4577 RepID=A0A804LF55_MAIZE
MASSPLQRALFPNLLAANTMEPSSFSAAAAAPFPFSPLWCAAPSLPLNAADRTAPLLLHSSPSNIFGARFGALSICVASLRTRALCRAIPLLQPSLVHAQRRTSLLHVPLRACQAFGEMSRWGAAQRTARRGAHRVLAAFAQPRRRRRSPLRNPVICVEKASRSTLVDVRSDAQIGITVVLANAVWV